MVPNLISAVIVAVVTAAAVAHAQAPAQERRSAPARTSAEGERLGIIAIPQSVLAGGTRLDPGTYEVRLTPESLSPLPGQSPGAERRVEFVAQGRVVARDAAVVHEPEIVGTSGDASARVQLLRGGEFVRVSATRDGKRYLIHLPVAP